MRLAHEQYLQGQERHFRLLIAAQIAYFTLLFGFLVYTGNWPTPTQIAIALFLLALMTARPLRFLRDWSPFVFLLLSYEALRGLSDGLVAGTSVQFPIRADRELFGVLPTHYLQDRLWDPENIQWYDYVAAFVHPLHFVLPLGVAFGFWMSNSRHYWRFVGSYALLTYAGLVTYILYPMAPPWYAAEAGAIAPVERILDQVLWRHSVSQPLGFVYENFNPNPVAAMPSLHAAFPVLVFLVAVHLRPRWGWLTAAYPAVMDFALVYMGEHYVVDIFAGTIYGVVAFLVVWVLPGRIAAWRGTSPDGEQPAPGPSG